MREAMRLALEGLEYIYEGANNQGPHTGISWRDVSNKAEPIIAALRQALANEALDRMAENERELGIQMQPDEPVAWFGYSSAHDAWFHTNEGEDDSIPLYRRPQPAAQWVGLTDEEVQAILDKPEPFYDTMFWFARKIEQALKEKNT